LAIVEHDHVFASVITKSTEPIEEFKRGDVNRGEGIPEPAGLSAQRKLRWSKTPQQLLGNVPRLLTSSARATFAAGAVLLSRADHPA